MNAKGIAIDVIALAAGFAVGYGLTGAKPAREAPGAKPAARAVADVGLAASERALSARIRELEAMYKSAPAPEKTVVEADAKYWKPFVSTNADGSVSMMVMLGSMSFDLKKHMEKLRKKDPKEFESRVKFRREMSDQIADGYDERIRFFEQVDDSWLGEEDRANFNRLVDKLKMASDNWRRDGQWDLPFEQRKLVDSFSFRVCPTIPNEYPKVRSMFLKRTAEVMGLDDESAGDFISTVNDIERMTSRYATVSLPPEKKRK